MAPKINTTTTKVPSSNIPITTIIRLAFIYFAVVFGTGFILGTIRQLYVVPTYHLPSALAEIIEIPLMFVAVIVWANWLVNHYDIPAKGTVRLGVGLLGLGFMVCVEFMGSRFVGGQGPVEKYKEMGWAVMARVLYLLDLMVFGLMPWILLLTWKKGRESRRRGN